MLLCNYYCCTECETKYQDDNDQNSETQTYVRIETNGYKYNLSSRQKLHVRDHAYDSGSVNCVNLSLSTATTTLSWDITMRLMLT